MAAWMGNQEICKYLLGRTEIRDIRNKFEWAPLHLAAEKGHLEVCKVLLENQVDKNSRTNDGWTPLQLAAH